jgi:hypothetical protein
VATMPLQRPLAAKRRRHAQALRRYAEYRAAAEARNAVKHTAAAQAEAKAKAAAAAMAAALQPPTAE